MGTIPLEEYVEFTCIDGRTGLLSVDTTTSDVSMDEDGTAWISGRIGGQDAISFNMPLSMYTEAWFRRLCNAIHSYPDFLTSLLDRESINTDFVIPAAPIQNTSAINHLIKMGKKANFRDFADLRSGRDKFSAMKLPDLEKTVDPSSLTTAQEHLRGIADVDHNTELAKVLRWMLRGLPVAMALQKTEVDREIAANVGASRGRRPQ